MSFEHKVPLVSTGRFSVLSVDGKDGGVTGDAVMSSKEPFRNKTLGADPCQVKGYTISHDCVAVSLELASPGSLVSKIGSVHDKQESVGAGSKARNLQQQVPVNKETYEKVVDTFKATANAANMATTSSTMESVAVLEADLLLKLRSSTASYLQHNVPVVSTGRFTVFSVDSKDGLSYSLETKKKEHSKIRSTVLGTDPCRVQGYTAVDDFAAVSLEVASPGSLSAKSIPVYEQSTSMPVVETPTKENKTKIEKVATERRAGPAKPEITALAIQQKAEKLHIHSETPEPMTKESAPLSVGKPERKYPGVSTVKKESLVHAYPVVSTARFSVLSVDCKDGKTQATRQLSTNSSQVKATSLGTDPLRLQNYKAMDDVAATSLEIASPGVLRLQTASRTTQTTNIAKTVDESPLAEVEPLAQDRAPETNRARALLPSQNTAFLEKSFEKNVILQTHGLTETKVLSSDENVVVTSKAVNGGEAETDQLIVKIRDTSFERIVGSGTAPDFVAAEVIKTHFVEKDNNLSPEGDSNDVTSSPDHDTKSTDVSSSGSLDYEQKMPLCSESPDQERLTRKLLVLVSNQSFDREVVSNQERAFTILQSQNIAYETLDGADFANKDRRNELFGISGLRAKYPQFFTVEENGTTTFWGGWERFELANEEGSLESNFGSDSRSSHESKSLAFQVSDGQDVESPNYAPETRDYTSASDSVGKRLLVLVSNQSLDREVVANQQRAFTILQSKNIAYDTLDGADSANKDRRNELFGISGMRARYPQFFLVEEHGATTFWGDWERFEYANEDGSLVTEICSVSNIAVANGKQSVTAAANEFVGDDGTPVAAVQREGVHVPQSTSASATAGKRLLVLVSNQSLDREVVANQQRAFTILQSKNIAYDTLDGADSANKDRRNELFGISGMRARYPQFFLVEEHGATTFWGDWERFEYANEDGSVVLDLGVPRTYSHELNDKSLELADSTVISSSNESTVVPPSNSSTSKAASVPEQTKTILVLVSSKSPDHNVRADQDRILSFLNSKDIAFQTCDGSNEANYKRRDELFMISGAPDVYPQLFIVEGSKTSVCRDIDGWKLGNVESSQGESREISAITGGAEVVVEGASTGAEVLERSESGGQEPTPTGSQDILIVNNNTTEALRSGVQVDITVYGASSFVARHVLTYLTQASLALSNVLKVTLAGRSREKLELIAADLTQKMTNLKIINEGTQGGCEFDLFVAESSELLKLREMAKRSLVVLSCAGPFARYGSNVVDACASVGADYVDITGEVSWASEMRLKHGDKAKKSGSRIISFCGFDSVPSDLAILAAVDALSKAVPDGQVEIETGITWHAVLGGFNGGTAQTMVDMPLNLHKCFNRKIPFLLDDPLALTHPRFRVDDRNDRLRDRLACSEWFNQLLSFDTIFKMGVSVPFLMAPVNAKVVHASALALGYGPAFTYRERYLPTGFRMTTSLRLISLVPALITQFFTLALTLILKLPSIGQKVVETFLPPGQGSHDLFCQHGHAEVYAQVSSGPSNDGSVMRANSFLSFKGDPGNWVTAQCVCEAALALLLNRDQLPPRSEDGFGTPAELLGQALLTRLLESQVRPVQLATHVRLRAPRAEWRMYP